MNRHARTLFAAIAASAVTLVAACAPMPAPTSSTTTTTSSTSTTTSSTTTSTSTTTTVAPDTVAPSLGGTLGVSAIDESSIAVSWSAASDNVTSPSAMTYQVCVSTSATLCQSVFSALTSVTGVTSATLSGLSSSTTYYVRVRARDAAGNVSGSIGGSATTGPV